MTTYTSLRTSLFLPWFSAMLALPPSGQCCAEMRRDNLDSNTQRIVQAVNSAATTFMSSKQTIGLSVGVFAKGRTYLHHFGTVERSASRKPDLRTMFPIASITKTFTATLLAMAVVENKAKLDDDVRKYLGSGYTNLEMEGQPIRLYQLINHTSGLPRSLPENGDETMRKWLGEPDEASFTQYDSMHFLLDLRSVKLVGVPGREFRYSNSAAQLLGLVLEGIYKTPYEELVRQKIMQPLKMSSTKVSLTELEIMRSPKGYKAEKAFLPALSTKLPAAASLWSTAEDMMKYIAWHVRERKPAVRLTHTPPVSPEGSTPPAFSVGLNWQILRDSGRRIIFQDGYIPGYHSLCVFCPELDLGVIVLSNEEERATPTRVSPMVNSILKALDPRAPSIP